MPGFVDAASLRASVQISEIIGQVTKLAGSNRKMMGRCPLHNDRTPSLSVNDHLGVFHCFGCGAGGDVFDFVMQYESIDFAGAVDRVAGMEISRDRFALPSKPSKPQDRSGVARKMWDEARHIENSVAERYLISTRGIDIAAIPDSSTVRFTRLAYEGDHWRHPVLLCAVRNAAGILTGVQRTYLDEHGQKLNVAKPKMSLGAIKGSAIQIGAGEAEIVLCEGLEDGLSLRQMAPDLPVWVAAGAGMMKDMQLPSDCRSVVIAADSDNAGEKAAKDASAVFLRQGRAVRIIRPEPPFKDFNEYAQEAAR